MLHDNSFMQASLDGGFGQPVFEAQESFRRLLDAMARPGSIHQVTADVMAPGLAGPAQAALALTLCDADTPVWCAAASPAHSAWLAFHTGAPLTAAPEQAAFAFIGVGDAVPDDLSLGTQDYPDRSATLVIEVQSFGEGERFRLIGPGIDGAGDLAVDGLPKSFVAFRAANSALFPRGVDVVLTAGRDIVALPRSTTFVHWEG
ncbi:phosphonate C-P lyase system protein PhnH [Pleomorphomonas oryzae]|uniref:phosphonate C-P lyase system protein PhnH n=1 Tax=Pleomorphomonas oryzae TaxID=261934 RepID=UPI0004220E40|nr:phosphonate C-P lyase system protein PhnH [Pleomorphomonas oryzae]